MILYSKAGQKCKKSALKKKGWMIDVTGSIKDGFPIDLKLGPGESGKVEYGYPARPGTYHIDAEAWPEGAEDIYPPDNRDRITITVENEVFDLDTEIRSGVLR